MVAQLTVINDSVFLSLWVSFAFTVQFYRFCFWDHFLAQASVEEGEDVSLIIASVVSLAQWKN